MDSKGVSLYTHRYTFPVQRQQQNTDTLGQVGSGVVFAKCLSYAQDRPTYGIAMLFIYLPFQLFDDFCLFDHGVVLCLRGITILKKTTLNETTSKTTLAKASAVHLH